MSKGYTLRHVLHLNTADDSIKEELDKIQAYANDLPIGVIGFQARATAAVLYPNVTNTPMTFDTVDWDTDNFTQTGAFTTFQIPPGLGGLYAFSFYTNSQAIYRFVINNLECLGVADMTKEILTWSAIIPRIFLPGETFDIRLNPTPAVTITPQTAVSLTIPKSPVFTVTRINPATLSQRNIV